MNSERTKSKTANLGLIAVIAVAGLYGSIGCNGGETPPTAFDADYRLIIPQTGAAAAAVDGLNTDAKWGDAFSLNLIDGASMPGAIMEGVSDADNIYLYFQIDDTGFDPTDMVVIALNPTSAAADNRLLLIRPCPSGSAGCPSTDDDLPVDIDYFVDSDGDGEWESAAGHGVTARSATSGGTVWAVEVAIPRGAPFNFPDTEYFGLYANIIETSFAEIAAQYTWPFVNEAGDTIIFGTPEDTPATGVWGNATLNTGIGNGVRISSRDIRTNHGPSTISSDEPNTFYASAHNNTLSSGTLVDAQQVRATFKWASFGLPTHSSFQKIPTDASPAAGNPTAYSDIVATGSHTYTLDWTVPGVDQDFYEDNPKWCIKVELDSSDASTVFYRQQAQRNMAFVETASPFKSRAVVDPLGYRLPENARQHQYLLEERFYNTDPQFKWVSRIDGAHKVHPRTYKLGIDDTQKANLGFSIEPPVVINPSFEIPVQSGSGGAFASIPVRHGQLITIVVEDALVAVPPKPGLPDGSVSGTKAPADIKTGVKSRQLVEPETAGGAAVADNPGLVNDAVVTVPDEQPDRPRSTAVVTASWDQFDNSKFVVPYAVSLKPPKGAEKLYLKLAGAGSPEETRIAKVYVSKIQDYQLQQIPSLALDRNQNGIVHLGANLPTVVYHGKRFTGKTITIDKQTFQVYQSAGAFGYIVKGDKRKD